jgi:hypothetical protein
VLAARAAVTRTLLQRLNQRDAAMARDAGSLPTDAVDEVFVFSPTDTYGPDPAPNVKEIDHTDVVEFIRNERSSLPETVEQWISRASDMG